MEPNDSSEEITSLKIDKRLNYLHDSEKDDEETWSSVQQALHIDVHNHEDTNHHKYNLPQPSEIHSFSKNVYDNYQNIRTNNIAFESDWRLLYRVQGKVIYTLFDAFFAELYFNTENHYLMLVIKGTSSIGNVWSDIKNVGLGSKGGELDSAFTFGEKVRVLMNKFKCKPMLLITGHSLGGYLAQIITYTITYCFVDENGKVKSRKEPMDDFGIYTMVFDSPAALKQISSIVPRDPIQPERLRLPIVNFIVDVNIINSNSKVGPHLGQVISVKEFKDLNAPNKWQRIIKAKSVHGIQKFEDIDRTQCRQVEYLPHRKTVKYEKKEIQNFFFSSKNFERLHKYSFFNAMFATLVERLPKFQIFSSHVFLQDEKVSPEEFIPRAHRFLSHFKDDLDSGVFDGKNVIDDAIYNLWRAEMLKDAHEFFLNEEWIQKVENWMDGTKIGGFESYEEMRFVGCMLHNSILTCFHYDYEQFNELDKKVVDNFKATNAVTLILIVKNKNQKISDIAGKKVKIVYMVQDFIADEKVTLNPSALHETSQELLKNTQLQFMGNKVSAVDIFGHELMENLSIWEIYNFYKDAVQKPNHFYSDQAISKKRAFFKSAVAFARELMKREMQFVLISSDAGIGKSTALKQIALTLQQEFPNNWIVHINLFDIQYELSRAKDKLTSKEAAVEFVRNLELADLKSDEVLTKVFNWKSKDKKIVFLFDSLDEVCPLHRKTVEKFIALLRETQLMIVLTTRPHEGKNFQDADLCKLELLNLPQKRNFINKKFNVLGKKPPPDVEKWLRSINYISRSDYFWSLPLNLNMATSIYDADEDISESSEFKGGKNIYEVFLTKSIENTLKIKFNLEKNHHQAASMQIYQKNVDKFNELFEDLAVCLIFHGGIIDCIKSKELKSKIKKNGESINRFDVANLDNNYKFVSFLHKSYAEYLVAQVFLKCHQTDQNQKFQLNKKQLKSIYFKTDFYEVREHICRILAASSSVKMDFVPFFIKLNRRKLLEVLIYEDCYELYMQIKNYITFSFKYSIFGLTYYNDLNPLYSAMKNARRAFVRQLIEDGAKFEDTVNEDGVLHLAIEKGLHQEVKDHFENLKVNVHVEHFGKLPLHYAAQYASRDLVEFLIENGADVDAKNKLGKTALFYAIEANNAEVCELMIAKGADCTKALKWAAEYGSKESFDVVYKNTPNECREERVRKAHFEAAFKGNLDIFQHICELPEASPLALYSDESTFVHCAAINGHLHCMPFIVEYMNQSVDIKGSFGETALMRALFYDREEVVQWLLGQKADIRAVDNKGRSCLHFAASGGNLHCVEMCLDAGADINSQDNDGQTALYRASQYSINHLVKFLLEKGANHEITDKDGNTCLHAVCESHSLECVILLVDLLPLSCTNKKGETPLHLAALKGNEENVAYLLEEAKKRKLEPVDSETIIRLTKRIREVEKDSKSHEDVKKEILKWQYLVKDV